MSANAHRKTPGEMPGEHSDAEHKSGGGGARHAQPQTSTARDAGAVTRGEMKEGFAKVLGEMKEEFANVRAEMKEGFAKVGARFDKTDAKIDRNAEKSDEKIDTVGARVNTRIDRVLILQVAAILAVVLHFMND